MQSTRFLVKIHNRVKSNCSTSSNSGIIHHWCHTNLELFDPLPCLSCTYVLWPNPCLFCMMSFINVPWKGVPSLENPLHKQESGTKISCEGNWQMIVVIWHAALLYKNMQTSCNIGKSCRNFGFFYVAAYSNVFYNTAQYWMLIPEN